MISGESASGGKMAMHLKWRQLTITEAIMAKTRLNPVHPGEVLSEEFLKPIGLSQSKLANAVGVPPRRINEIVLRQRAITADTALRLAKYFGNSARFWLGLQMDYDLDVADAKLGDGLSKISRRRAG